MTVSSTTSQQTFACNGSTLVFACPFRVLDAAEMRVFLITAATGASIELSNGSDFTVTGVGDPNATVTTATAYSSAYLIKCVRSTALLQLVDYRDNDPFPAESHETALDRLTHIAQEVRGLSARALLFPEPEDGATLPAVADRADKLLSFNSSGAPVAVAPSSGSAAALAVDLASTASGKGSAMVGHDFGAVAGALDALGRMLQGADPTGATDSTSALRALLDACIPSGLEAVIPAGTYLVSGPISNPAQIAAGALHVRCVGDVTINVSGSAAAFTSLLSCYTTAINSSTIKGGRLTLNLNNKVSNGIYLRHAGMDGGTVDWRGITVLSAKENDAGSTAENQGLLIYGRYKSVTLDGIDVDGVTRTNAAGACKGISVSEFVGLVRIVAAAVSRVLTGGGTGDADGIACFGRQLSGVYGRRAGRVEILGATFTDCQGRSIKLQASDALIDRPVFDHQAVVTVAGADIDAQVGGSIAVRAPLFTYRLNGATSPIGTGFYPVSLQQQCTDAPNDMQIIDPMVRTEVTMTRFAFVTVGTGSAAGFNAVTGLQVQPLGALATSAFTRAVVEFDAGQVAASSNTTHISVRGTRANLSGVPLIGHTGFTTGVTNVSAKLSIDAVGNENTGAVNAATSVLAAISGNNISSMLRFMLRDNPGINDFMPISSFDYQTLPVGSRFHYDLATVTASNGPSLGASGIACVEVLGQLNATAGSRSIRVVKDNANAANTVFQTQTGTWGAIK